MDNILNEIYNLHMNVQYIYMKKKKQENWVNYKVSRANVCYIPSTAACLEPIHRQKKQKKYNLPDRRNKNEKKLCKGQNAKQKRGQTIAQSCAERLVSRQLSEG